MVGKTFIIYLTNKTNIILKTHDYDFTQIHHFYIQQFCLQITAEEANFRSHRVDVITRIYFSI